MSEETTSTDNTVTAATEGQEQTAINAAENQEASEANAEEVTKDVETGAEAEAETAESTEESVDEVAEEGDAPDAATTVEQALAEVVMPEGIVATEEGKAALTEVVSKHGLSQETVKDLAEYHLKQQTSQQGAQRDYLESMHKEAMALPKETLVNANKFVTKYGSEDLQAKMADPNYHYGNDKDVLQILATAQKAVDGGFVDGDSGGTASADAKGLYPKSNMK